MVDCLTGLLFYPHSSVALISDVVCARHQFIAPNSWRFAQEPSLSISLHYPTLSCDALQMAKRLRHVADKEGLQIPDVSVEAKQ